MPEPDLGEKRACSECGILFFDLNKSPPECPKCQRVINVVSTRGPALPQKAEATEEDVVDDSTDEVKQDVEEFEDDTDSVGLGPAPKPGIADEALEDE